MPGTGLFNGNIAGMKWGIKSEPIRGYQFSYDNLNRMKQGNYAEGSSLDADQVIIPKRLPDMIRMAILKDYSVTTTIQW